MKFKLKRLKGEFCVCRTVVFAHFSLDITLHHTRTGLLSSARGLHTLHESVPT